jgi:hypothetical protein
LVFLANKKELYHFAVQLFFVFWTLHIFVMKRLQNKKLLDVGVAPPCLPRKDLDNHWGIAPTNKIMNMCNAFFVCPIFCRVVAFVYLELSFLVEDFAFAQG